MSKTPECHQNVNYCEKKVKKFKKLKYVKSRSFYVVIFTRKKSPEQSQALRTSRAIGELWKYSNFSY